MLNRAKSIVLIGYTHLRSYPLELWIWLIGLGAIIFGSTSGPSLCLLHFLGFEHCPGCGLGRSIHEAVRFNFTASWNYHPLGIPGFIIISFRIFRLTQSTVKQNKL